MYARGGSGPSALCHDQRCYDVIMVLNDIGLPIDYSPLKFIVPNTGSWELNVEPNRRTVLCAIVSPREPELLKVSLELDFLGVIDIGTGTSYGYLHAVYSEVSAVALLYDCQAKTAWEDITISYQITTRPRSEAHYNSW